MNKPVVFAVAGRKEAGKTTLCEAFQSYVQTNKLLGGPCFVKCSFAAALKTHVSEVFGLDYELMTTIEGKNTRTHLEWTHCPSVLNPEEKMGYMTVREILQVYGEFARLLYPDTWVDNLYRTINRFSAADIHKNQVFLIDDCRFQNEIGILEELQDSGFEVFLVCLRRSLYRDSAASEQLNLHFSGIDSDRVLDLDNQNMTKKQKENAVFSWLEKNPLFNNLTAQERPCNETENDNGNSI